MRACSADATEEIPATPIIKIMGEEGFATVQHTLKRLDGEHIEYETGQDQKGGAALA